MGLGKVMAPHTRRDQHAVGGDGALFRHHGAHTAALNVEALDLAILENLPTARASPLGQGGGDIQRVHLPV